MGTDFSGQVNHQESSVGVAIRRNIVSRLSHFCIAYSARLMSLRLPLIKDRSVPFVSVYAPQHLILMMQQIICFTTSFMICL